MLLAVCYMISLCQNLNYLIFSSIDCFGANWVFGIGHLLCAGGQCFCSEKRICLVFRRLCFWHKLWSGMA